jgi:hypothetical protein
MKYLLNRWKPRSAIILAASLGISIFMIALEMTDWATQINQQGYSHGDGEPSNPASVLQYILPFVKEMVLIGVPMSLSLFLMRLFGRKRRAK